MCKLYLKIFKNVAALASFENRTSESIYLNKESTYLKNLPSED